MQVRVPVGTGYQYMQTAHMHNPTVIGEVCAEDFAREHPVDAFGIRKQALATEIKLQVPRMPQHERHYLEGYRDRLERLADEIERESVPTCSSCGEAILSDEPHYSCSPAEDTWHAGCYSYEPGDEEEPVKFFEGETRQHG